jgi:hypothetical protein
MTPDGAFARMHFEGIFTLKVGQIADPGVLGDVHGPIESLTRNAEH